MEICREDNSGTTTCCTIEESSLLSDEEQSEEEFFRNAVESGNEKVVSKKIKENAFWIEHRWPNKETPLIKASSRYNDELVRILIKLGAHLEATDCQGETALHAAAKYGWRYVVRTLLEAGANINASNGTGLTPAMMTVPPPGTNGIHAITMICTLKLLIERGADLEKKDTQERTALHLAVIHERIGAIGVLLEHGANLESAAKGGHRPLHLATGRLKILRLLVNKGADIDSRNDDGLTPLHLTVRRGNIHAVKFLLENGADVNASTNRGYTPLHYAARQGNDEIVICLLTRFKMQISINAVTKSGMTALHVAVLSKKIRAVKCLVQNGAAMDILTNSGKTALDLAYEVQMQTIIDFLRETIGGASPANISHAVRVSTTNEQHSTEKEVDQALKGSDDKNLAGSRFHTPTSLMTQQTFPEAKKSRGHCNQDGVKLGIEECRKKRKRESGFNFNVDYCQQKNVPPCSNKSQALEFLGKEAGVDPKVLAILISAGSEISKEIMSNSDERKKLQINLSQVENQIKKYEKELLEKTSEFEIKLEQQKHEIQCKSDENNMQATEIKKLKVEIAENKQKYDSGETLVKYVLPMLQDQQVIKKLDSNTLSILEGSLESCLGVVRRSKEHVLLERVKSEQLCVVCMDGTKSVLLLPCRHLCVCEVCSNSASLLHCPICRSKIQQKMTGIFSSSL